MEFDSTLSAKFFLNELNPNAILRKEITGPNTGPISNATQRKQFPERTGNIDL